MIHIQLQDCLLNQFFRSDPLGNHYKVIEHVLDTTFRFLLHAPGAYWRARLASVSQRDQTSGIEQNCPKDVILCTVAHSLSSSAVFHTFEMLRAICGSTSLQWFGSAYRLCCLLMRKMEVRRAKDMSNRQHYRRLVCMREDRHPFRDQAKSL